MHEDYTTADALRRQRDAKARPHLSQYAPVWLINEDIFLDENEMLFEVVFQHNTAGWVVRRYRYDGFNNILHHKGQRILDEDAVLDITEDEPYITSILTDIPNAYGG